MVIDNITVSKMGLNKGFLVGVSSAKYIVAFLEHSFLKFFLSSLLDECWNLVYHQELIQDVERSICTSILLNLITGCDGLTTFLEKMTSWICFDSFGSNGIFYLKVQSSTFVGIKIKIFSSNIYSRNGWENSGTISKTFHDWWNSIRKVINLY